MSHAYTVGEISFVYPITRSAPAFLPLFAFLFLNERVSVQGMVGIFCVIVSILLFQQREERIQFKAFFRFLREPDALWSYATLGSVIAYSLIDKQGMFEFNLYLTDAPWWRAGTFYLTENIISQTLYGVFCIVRFPRKLISQIGRTEWKRSLAVAGLSMISYSLILYVLMTEKVSYVTAVRQCSVIFVVLLGGLRIERDLYKTQICRCGCYGNWHLSDRISVTVNIEMFLFDYNRFLNRKTHPISHSVQDGYPSQCMPQPNLQTAQQGQQCLHSQNVHLITISSRYL